MRKKGFSVALLPAVLLLAACPKKSAVVDDAAVEDAAAEAAAALVTPPVMEAGTAEPAAKNAADVARFPGETRVADDDATLADALTAARTAPKVGSVVAQLKAGSEVMKIAEYQDSVLIAFADPKDEKATLMGWVPKGGFVADSTGRDGGTKDGGLRDGGAKDGGAADAAAPAVDAGAKPAAKCGAGEEQVVLAAGPVCKKKCSKDADCKTKGAGACAPANTPSGKVARVCGSE